MATAPKKTTKKKAWKKKSADAPSYTDEMASRIIKALEEGVAPWVKPWAPGAPKGNLPYNPTTKKHYQGMNAISLLSAMYSDTRWLTFKQAQALEANVRKGEKGTRIQYWSFEKTVDKLDSNGKPVRDSLGNKVTETIRLDNPRAFYATVFNAEQIENMPEDDRKIDNTVYFADVEKAERLAESTGAHIVHVFGDRAFYGITTDKITMPEKSQFATQEDYYSTLLHELGHWTGHPSRLDRDLSGDKDSPTYAMEELRAEIASFLLCSELGLGHDPSQHMAYIGDWVQGIKDDPMVIFKATADAEKIRKFILSHDMEHELKVVKKQERDESVEMSM